MLSFPTTPHHYITKGFLRTVPFTSTTCPAFKKKIKRHTESKNHNWKRQSKIRTRHGRNAGIFKLGINNYDQYAEGSNGKTRMLLMGLLGDQIWLKKESLSQRVSQSKNQKGKKMKMKKKIRGLSYNYKRYNKYKMGISQEDRMEQKKYLKQ